MIECKGGIHLIYAPDFIDGASAEWRLGYVSHGQYNEDKCIDFIADTEIFNIWKIDSNNGLRTFTQEEFEAFPDIL